MIVINFIYSIIGTPLGYVMWVIYLLVKNFGVAVILFTLVVKLASFPLTLKQQKNMAMSQLFMPRVQEVQKKYRNNQQKLQEEMGKLQKEGYNPMGGCGPMILILVILFGVIDVVYKPMTHLERFEWAETGSIETVKQIGAETDYTSIILASEEDRAVILEYIEDRESIYTSDSKPQVTAPAEFVAAVGVTAEERETYGTFIYNNITTIIAGNSRISADIKSRLQRVQTNYGSSSLQGELHAVQSFAKSPEAFVTPRISGAIYEKLETLQENMIFVGLDLGQIPTLTWPIMLIPIFSFIFSALQMLVTTRIQKKTMPEMAAAGGSSGMSMKVMMYITPLFSLFIVFTVPAGAGFYWGISYLIGIAQSLIMYKFFPTSKLREEAMEKAKLKNVRLDTTATVVDVDEAGQEVVREERVSDMSGKEQKEFFRKKLEEARRLDALKYGDEDIAELPPESDNVEEKKD